MKWFLRFFYLMAFLLPGLFLFAQDPLLPVVAAEQQLENITASDDAEPENDDYLRELQQYLRSPLNINLATEEDLVAFTMISSLQAHQLVVYRNTFGKLISIYELQSVPGWDLETIRKIRPYITVSDMAPFLKSLKENFRKGENGFLIRISRVLEKQKGYKPDPVSSVKSYAGSPLKMLLRYRYDFRHQLSYGFVAEKDAGEQFFKGSQQKGFDFYSAHFFVRGSGLLRSLALGDFSVNLGQGLVKWQGLALKKSAEVIAIERQSEVLKPYTSAGEALFHRGAAVTLRWKKFLLLGFGSFRNLDANRASDSAAGTEPWVSSWQTSGFHRTVSELADRSVLKQSEAGMSLKWTSGSLQLGFNAVRVKLGSALIRNPQPYNSFFLQGKKFTNGSLDYRFTCRNFHFFGELAAAGNFTRALLTGVQMAVSPGADLSFLYRDIDPGYQSWYANAFTESASVNNERGLYAGISIHPGGKLKVDAYADFFRFPWLKFNTDAPSEGTDYLVQVSWNAGKNLQLYSRFRNETKPVNGQNETILTPIPLLKNNARQDWRLQFNYKLKNDLGIRSRFEFVWFGTPGAARETGSSVYADFYYDPPGSLFSGNIRLQYFETDSYDTRIYAYENDVPFSYSIPAFYGKGYRCYLNIGFRPAKKLGGWIRLARTEYPGKILNGSGPEEIAGAHKTELKAELFYKF